MIEVNSQKCINFMKTRKINLIKNEMVDRGRNIKLMFDNEVVILVFPSGKILVQGKIGDEEKKVLHQDLLSYIKEKSNNKIFIVYGHDRISRNELELLLLKWGLKPVVLEDIVNNGSQTIIEKLENQLEDCSYGIVIATPDDIGGSALKPDELHYRVRQNVVLELGMLMASASIGRKRVMILMKQNNLDKKFEKPSDVDGLIYISYEYRIKEKEHQIYQQLIKSGFDLKI